MIFQLHLPNSYASEADREWALIAAFGNDADKFRGYADAEIIMYAPIACAARSAGLAYLRRTWYGAEWSGTREQFEVCRAALPEWARRYASEVEGY